MSPFRLHCGIPVSPGTLRVRHHTYHVKVKVGNLALAVASESETVGQSSDTVLSRVECLFAVMREGGFRILEENNRKNTKNRQAHQNAFQVDRGAFDGRITYGHNHLGNRESIEQRSSTVRAVVVRDVRQDHALSAW